MNAEIGLFFSFLDESRYDLPETLCFCSPGSTNARSSQVATHGPIPSANDLESPGAFSSNTQPSLTSESLINSEQASYEDRQHWPSRMRISCGLCRAYPSRGDVRRQRRLRRNLTRYVPRHLVLCMRDHRLPSVPGCAVHSRISQLSQVAMHVRFFHGRRYASSPGR